MGAFLSAISGAGGPNAAGRYGEQIRGLLEQRRGDFSNLISQAAAREWDPQTKAALLQHSADLLSGKPIGQIAQKFSQTLTKRQQDNDALAQTIGPPPQAPQSQPGPAQPGQMPGTPQSAQSAPAAQPSTSLVQPGAQAANEPAMPDLGQTPIPPVSAQGIAANAPPMSESLGMPAGMAAQIPGIPPIGGEFGFSPLEKEIVNHYMAAAHGGMGIPPDLQAAAQPIFQRMAQLEQEKGIAGWRLSQIEPFLKNMDPQMANFVRMQILGGGAGVGAMIGALAPVSIPGMETAASLLAREPEFAMANGLDKIDPNSPVRVQRSKLPPYHAIAVEVQSVPNQIRYNEEGQAVGVNPRTLGVSEPIKGVTAPTMISPRNVGVTAQGNPQFESFEQMRKGAPPVQGAGKNPAFYPTTSLRSITTTDADGNPVTELVPVTSQKGAGVAANKPGSQGAGGGPPGAGRTFAKPFTQEQRLKNEQSLGQYNLAIDRATSVQKNLHLLDSLIDAGKLQLQADPNTGFLEAVVNRNVPMTPAESQFVADFQTLREDINLLRGPLGATGFRGPEAFAALQAQRGQLLARPEITRNVLENTIKAMKVQRDALEKAQHPGTAGAAATHNAPVDVKSLRDKYKY